MDILPELPWLGISKLIFVEAVIFFLKSDQMKELEKSFNPSPFDKYFEKLEKSEYGLLKLFFLKEVPVAFHIKAWFFVSSWQKWSNIWLQKFLHSNFSLFVIEIADWNFKYCVFT